MIMIDGLPHVIEGFDDDLVESIEYFDGVEWKERPFNLVYPTYVYYYDTNQSKNVFKNKVKIQFKQDSKN